MRSQFILASALFVLVGCCPEFEGTAEYTFKSSEVLKALSGQPARIRLHENVSWTMSNAYERVTFGEGRFTNQLDVVKALIDSRDGILLPLHDFYTKHKDVIGELTNDMVRLTVDETPGKTPVLRMEADVGVWLSQTNVLERALDERRVNELIMLAIDSKTGGLDCVDPCGFKHINPRQLVFVTIGVRQYFLLTTLFGKESKSPMTMASAYAALPAMPEYISDQIFTIVGDSDEPLGVEAKNVVVDDKHHDTFKVTVKRGETLRLKCNKNHNPGGIRFLVMDSPERRMK